MRRKAPWIAGAAALVLLVLVAWLAARRPFPPDTTPEGAYLRIALALTQDRPKDMFAYLETDAQWASYTIRDAHAKARDRVRASWPPGEERDRLLAAYGEEADAPDGSDEFAMLAQKRGWLARLRKDLSGIKSVEIQGERATVVTTRGTRYPFRRRENGIWGITIFTAELTTMSERASRELAAVNAAADDYDRTRANR